MKRYLLFSGPVYYPGGGWTDFIGDFASKDAARKAARRYKRRYSWMHVVDTETKEIILEE